MEFKSGNSCVFYRPIYLAKKGDFVVGHQHNFPHDTYVLRGAFLFEFLDKLDRVIGSTIIRATDECPWVLIKAERVHRITALEDDSRGHCLYANRTPQGDVVQEYTGWPPAYA